MGRTSLNLWIKQVDTLRPAKQDAKSLHPGRKRTGQHLHDTVTEIVLKNMDPPARATSVHSLAVAVMLKDPTFLVKEDQEDVARNGQYKRVADWVRRTLEFLQFSIRKPTHIAQNAESNVQICMDFVAHTVEVVKRMKIPTNCVVNMDQTNVPFDVCARTTIVPLGSKSVNMNKVKSKQTFIPTISTVL